MLLKLVAVLFPTTDRKHPVAEPALLLMGSYLSNCSLSSPRHATCGEPLRRVLFQSMSDESGSADDHLAHPPCARSSQPLEMCVKELPDVALRDYCAIAAGRSKGPRFASAARLA